MPSLQAISSIITGHVLKVMAGGFVVGVLCQDLAEFLRPMILGFIAVVMYFSFLRVDASRLSNELKSWPTLLLLLVGSLCLIPLVLFKVSEFLLALAGANPQLSVGVLVLFAAPTSALATTFTHLFGGRFERSMIIMVLSSFLAPITLPLMVKLFAGQLVFFDSMGMTKTLSLLVVLPFVLALVSRLKLTTITAKISPHGGAISIVALVLLEIASLAGFRQTVVSHWQMILGLLAFDYLILLSAFFLGWYMTPRSSSAEKLTSAIVTAWPNLGLAIGISYEFFRASAPDIVLYLSLMVLPWYSALGLLKLTQGKSAP